MSAARKATAWIWLFGPLVFLGAHIWNATHTDFVSLSYYVVSWGSLLVLALCGFWFVIDGPGAKWLVRIAATVVALYIGLMFLISSGNAPFYGGHDYVAYGVLALAATFCVFTIFIAGRNAT